MIRRAAIIAAALLAALVGYDLARGSLAPPTRHPAPELQQRADVILRRTGGDMNQVTTAEAAVLQQYIEQGGAKPPGFKPATPKPTETGSERMWRIYLNSWGDPTHLSEQDLSVIRQRAAGAGNSPR